MMAMLLSSPNLAIVSFRRRAGSKVVRILCKEFRRPLRMILRSSTLKRDSSKTKCRTLLHNIMPTLVNSSTAAPSKNQCRRIQLAIDSKEFKTISYPQIWKASVSNAIKLNSTAKIRMPNQPAPTSEPTKPSSTAVKKLKVDLRSKLTRV